MWKGECTVEVCLKVCVWEGGGHGGMYTYVWGEGRRRVYCGGVLEDVCVWMFVDVWMFTICVGRAERGVYCGGVLEGACVWMYTYVCRRWEGFDCIHTYIQTYIHTYNQAFTMSETLKSHDGSEVWVCSSCKKKVAATRQVCMYVCMHICACIYTLCMYT